MFEKGKDILLKLQLAAEMFTLSCIEIFPIFIIPVAFSFACTRFLEVDVQKRRRVRAELLFFSSFGAIGAFINYLSNGTMLENLLPSSVVAISFILHLFGIGRESKRGPLGSDILLIGCTGAAISFIFSSRYMILLFNPS